MKTPIRYYGGKQRLAPLICKLIPPHRVYIEPFCGGAAVFFKKPVPQVDGGHSYIEILNDIDGRLTNFYATLRDKPEEVVTALQLSQYNEREFCLAQDMGEHLDPVERVRRYFVVVRQCFSGGQESWGRELHANRALAWMQHVDRLPEAAGRLRGVTVSNDTAIKAIQRWDAEDAFFYLDPPYVGTDQSYYVAQYTPEMWQELVDTLNNLKGSFILSHYPTDVEPTNCIRMEKRIKLLTKAAKATTLKERTEVVWCRYNGWKPKNTALHAFRGSVFLAEALRQQLAAMAPVEEVDPALDDEEIAEHYAAEAP